jgi:hypothetical protein
MKRIRSRSGLAIMAVIGVLAALPALRAIDLVCEGSGLIM